MELRVEPDVQIVVLVKAEGGWSWYVSVKEYWLLDQVKLQAAFDGAGHPRDACADGRFEIPIVEESTRAAFLAHMTPFRVRHEQLVALALDVIAPAGAWEDAMHAFPALFVDFDAARLASMYTEPTRFELFVPEGWLGEWRDFLDEVPAALRYWVLEGVDHLARLMGGA